MPFRKCGMFILIEAFKSRLRCLHKFQVFNSSKDHQRTCDWKLQENMNFFSGKERNLWVHTCIDSSRAKKQWLSAHWYWQKSQKQDRKYWSQAQSRKWRIPSSDVQLKKTEDRILISLAGNCDMCWVGSCWCQFSKGKRNKLPVLWCTVRGVVPFPRTQTNVNILCYKDRASVSNLL